MAQPFMITAMLSLALLVPLASLGDCSSFEDADGDGYTTEVDCDDTDASINPGVDEPCECDGIDQNCNGVADDFPCDFPVCEDADGDGYNVDEDCNDRDPSIHPDQEEPCECDGIDQNCSGEIDDFPCDMVCPGNGVGEGCGGDYGECQEGLVCCYPCGIAGCEPNICHEPCYEDWCAGGCPLYP